jgi:hypothetical protein
VNNTVLLCEKFRVTHCFVTQFHFKNINRHNDSLIHTRFSLFINAEIIQPQNSYGFCNHSVNFDDDRDAAKKSLRSVRGRAVT